MNIYENQLKEQVKEVTKLGKMPADGEENQKHYSKIRRDTASSIKEYLRRNFKDAKAYKYWTESDDRLLTLFDGGHNKQINIILGR
nr:MAG TPA: hypothetical protein [Caudoviricetes sp.]